MVTLTGFPQDTSSPCRLVAAAYEWWNPHAPEGYYTYHWAAADVDISDQAEADFPADGGEVTLDAAIQSGFGHLTVTDNFGNGTTTTVSANQWYALPSALPAGPTVSISETDTETNQTVLAGNPANFDIHVDAGTTEPTAPLTVLYNTVDPSNAAPTAYYSTNGPVQERFVPADFQLDETTGDWVADKAFSIDTVAGIFDGDDVPLTVQLGNPYQCQLAGGGGGGGGGGGSSATATIVVPYIDMTAPSVKNVSGNGVTTTVIVGQQITLVAEVDAPYTVANEQWVIPGSTVKSYTQAIAASTLTTLTNDDLTEVAVTFYWIAPGNETVTCDFSVWGVRYHVTANFDVLVPASTFGASTTSNQPGGEPGGPVGVGSNRNPDPSVIPTPSLHFGTYGTGNFGITWNASVTASAGEGGSIEVVQLVDGTKWFTYRNQSVPPTVMGSFGNYVLDDSLPEGSKATYVEQLPRNLTTGKLTAPGAGGVLPVAANQTASIASVNIPGIDLNADWSAAGETARYITYLMYKPSGANSIWVTLQTISWAWGGSATHGPKIWTLDPGSYPGNPGIRKVGVGSATLPQWTNSWDNVSVINGTKISGMVTDQNGAAVAGALVTATWVGANGTYTLSATTNSNGQYAIYGYFAGLPVSLAVSTTRGTRFTSATVTPNGEASVKKDFSGVAVNVGMNLFGVSLPL